MDYSDASSIARFPNFQFSLHKVTPLSSLYVAARLGKGSRKVNVLLAALEVEGPDSIRIKKGVDAGKEVSILKMILGDEEGLICKLTAWREIAEAWGGFGPSPGLKRGDILYLESTLFPRSFESKILIHIRLIISRCHGQLGNGKFRYADRVSIQQTEH